MAARSREHHQAKDRWHVRSIPKTQSFRASCTIESRLRQEGFVIRRSVSADRRLRCGSATGDDVAFGASTILEVQHGQPVWRVLRLSTRRVLRRRILDRFDASGNDPGAKDGFGKARLVQRIRGFPERQAKVSRLHVVLLGEDSPQVSRISCGSWPCACYVDWCRPRPSSTQPEQDSPWFTGYTARMAACVIHLEAFQSAEESRQPQPFARSRGRAS